VLAGAEYLREYLSDGRTSPIPHLAIGGINEENARELAGVGCRGVAVSSAVCSASDPEEASRRILAALTATIEPARA
jgi:thiamine-phosphate pyrophosphorylase